MALKILTLDCTHKMLPTFSFLYQKRKKTLETKTNIITKHLHREL